MAIQGSIPSLPNPLPLDHYSVRKLTKRFAARVYKNATCIPLGLFAGSVGWVLGKIAKGLVIENASLFSEYLSNSVVNRTIGSFIPSETIIWITARCFQPFVSGCSLETIVKVANLAETVIPCIFYFSISVACAIKQEYDEYRLFSTANRG